MSLLKDAVYAEVFEVEQRLSSFEHKARKVLNFFRQEVARAYEMQPATRELYERITINRLMALRLAGQLLDKFPAARVSKDDQHLARLLMSADQRFADATATLSREYGELDFSADLPEKLQAEFGLDGNDAWLDACGIRGARAYAESHREEIIAVATAKGL
jgi:hypothetical protein